MKKNKGSLSRGQKIKFPAVALGLSLAMTAPSWGATWIVGDGNWNTPTKWSPTGVPSATTGVISSASVVTVNTAVPNITTLQINTGGKLILTTGGSLTTTGNVTISNSNVGTFEIDGTGTFSNSGNDFIVGNGTAAGNGTFKITGSAATINIGGMKANNSGVPDSKLWLVMGTTGISPINAAFADGVGSTGRIDLVADLSAYTITGLSSMTLMNIAGTAKQGTFAVAAGAITKGATTLTLGTNSASLTAGQYFIDYDKGTGSNDVVLSVNLIPEPSSMGLLALGGLGLLLRRKRSS